MGRMRLERELVALRASGGPELPPQTPEVTEGGQKTAAWFAQFPDDEAWARDELDSSRSIDAFLAAHGREPEVAAFAAELGALAEALRITDAELAEKRKELAHPAAWEKELSEQFGSPPADALSDLEYERAHDRERAAYELLEKRVPLESWDSVSRAWILTRGLGHADLIRRAGEIAGLDSFDPPAGRGIERFSVKGTRNCTRVCQALFDALPGAALRGNAPSFVRGASALLACGRLYSHGWGIIPKKMDAWALMMASRRIRECIALLPRDSDLGGLEGAVAAWNPRSDFLDALRRERAVGNEVFVDFGAGTTEAARVVDGWSFVERECVRLWLNHERAGYLEMLGQAIELAPRPLWEPGAGLDEWGKILEGLRPRHPWQMLRNVITPDLRGEALRAARFEVERQSTLLCLAVWREPDSLAARIAQTQDPFTGKPLSMREEDGVLVISSPGDGSEPIEARLRLR
jgi:hypothetical protein